MALTSQMYVDRVYRYVNNAGTATVVIPIEITQPRSLVLIGITENNHALPTTVQVNGQAAFQEVSALDTNALGDHIAWYTYKNPSVGNINVNMVTSNVGGAIIYVIQGASLRETNYITAAVNSAAAAMTATMQIPYASALLFDLAINSDGTSYTPGTDQVRAYNRDSGSSDTTVSSYKFVPTGTQIMSESGGTSQQCMVAIAIPPAQSPSMWNPNIDLRNSDDVIKPNALHTQTLAAAAADALDSYGQYGSQFFLNSFLHTVGRIFHSSPQGIQLDLAGNSGDQASASSYSGSATWNGSNRILCIDVSMLGPGVTVTAMTYGGANCTFIGARSSVTSFGRIEQWRILQSDSGAPAAGANTLSVTLSGSLEFAVEWVSYTGVHQDSPTEGFNSNQATNAGSADDATVTVTTVADNDWVHAAISANDTSITAGQTTRNNVAGTLGSGANEDNGGPKTPAGGVNMNYTGMGITTTWVIAGYALRPIAAASLLTGEGNDWPGFGSRGFWSWRFS